MLLKNTLGPCGRVLRYWEVPLELGQKPGEKHSPISKDQLYD